MTDGALCLLALVPNRCAEVEEVATKDLMRERLPHAPMHVIGDGCAGPEGPRLEERWRGGEVGGGGESEEAERMEERWRGWKRGWRRGGKGEEVKTGKVVEEVRVEEETVWWSRQ